MIKRKIKKRLTHRHRSFLLLAAGILVAVGFISVSSILFQPDNELFYFVDSKYAGVKTKYESNTSASQSSTIEYPVFKNSAVTQYVADAITAARQSITRPNPYELSAQPEHFAERVSYQITYNNKRFVSVIVYLLYDGDRSEPQSQTLYWTFDMRSGNVVTLSDLFAQSPDAMARSVIYVRNKIAANYRQHGMQASPEYLRELVTPASIQNFVVLDKQTLEFPFAQATNSEKPAPLTARLPIANLQLFLQNDIARSMLDVSPIDSAHAFDDTAKPIAPTAAAASLQCSTTKKCISLTYDDGPGIHTPELLTILKRNKVHATFFVIGRNAARSPDTLKRAINDGHLIGNHSWNHPWLPTKSEKQILDELTQTNTIIQKYTNKPVRYARPPYGAIDNKTYRVYKSLSLSAVFWSVDTRDWADRNASIVCNRVVAGARSGGIVILHDIHQSTVQATQCIIDNLKKRNYSFVTVDELLGEVAEPGNGYNRAE